MNGKRSGGMPVSVMEAPAPAPPEAPPVAEAAAPGKAGAARTHKDPTDGQYVVFSVGAETYGIPVARVQGIIVLPKVTKVPMSPPFVEGIINLRGNVLPVVNLQRRLGLAGERTEDAQVIVVEGQDQSGAVGLVVDGVSEVARIPKDAIDPTSAMIEGDTPYLVGLAKRESGLVLLLDPDALL